MKKLFASVASVLVYAVFFLQTRVAPAVGLAIGHVFAGLGVVLFAAGRGCKDVSTRLLPAVYNADQSYRYDYSDQEAEVFVHVTLPGRGFNKYLADAVRTKASDILDIAQRVSTEAPVTSRFHAEVGVKDGKPVLTGV